jgi:hypothetical protein
MFHKGPSFQRRLLTFQQNALGFGRNLFNQVNQAYGMGRHVAFAIDRSYQTFKKIHGTVAPALAEASPELAKMTKKAMSSYEATRAAVMNANTAGERIGAAVRREFA